MALLYGVDLTTPPLTSRPDHPASNAVCPTLHDCQLMDRQDPLYALRAQFQLPQGVIYLDGNSLGVLPKATPARVAQAVTQEWGQGLIRSWNDAGWFALPGRVGDKIARLVGAGPGEVVAVDSTSINLYKVLSAALHLASADAPGRTRVVSERSNFPTDLYIAQALCREQGFELVLVDHVHELAGALNPEVAVLLLTQVNYRTGSMHDMAAMTALAHAHGVLTVWDLAHSAGAVVVDLQGAQADFAVGCGYKFLNGGPGAPAFVWVHPRHADRFWQPLAGWWGHAAPFEFSPQYRPAPGIARYQCGTQPILSLTALDCGLDTVLAAEPLGGMPALRRKSLALTGLFMHLVSVWLDGHGLGIASPEEPARRGSQVSLTRGEGAYAIVQALIARGVIGDFRAGDGEGGRSPDILRFGFTPLYIGYADVWRAADQLRQVMERGEWREARFARRLAVT
jgi:kynureninase